MVQALGAFPGISHASEFAAGTPNEDGADYNSSINSLPSPEHAFFNVVSISPLSGLTGVGCYFCNICRPLQPFAYARRLGRGSKQVAASI